MKQFVPAFLLFINFYTATAQPGSHDITIAFGKLVSSTGIINKHSLLSGKVRVYLSGENNQLVFANIDAGNDSTFLLQFESTSYRVTNLAIVTENDSMMVMGLPASGIPLIIEQLSITSGFYDISGYFDTVQIPGNCFGYRVVGCFLDKKNLTCEKGSRSALHFNNKQAFYDPIMLSASSRWPALYNLVLETGSFINMLEKHVALSSMKYFRQMKFCRDGHETFGF